MTLHADAVAICAIKNSHSHLDQPTTQLNTAVVHISGPLYPPKMRLKGFFKRKKAAPKDKSKAKQPNKENEKHHAGNQVIPAASTDYTTAHSAENSDFNLSEVPHGSNINIAVVHDHARKKKGAKDKNDSKDGSSQNNYPKVIATKTRQKAVQMATRLMHHVPTATESHFFDGDSYSNVDSEHEDNKKKGKRSGTEQLGVMEILHAGYSVLSCVAQCRPISDGDTTVAPPVPKVIDPSQNDNESVGSLTLITIEREERRRTATAAGVGSGHLLCGGVGHHYAVGVVSGLSDESVAPVVPATFSAHPVVKDISFNSEVKNPNGNLVSVDNQTLRNRNGIVDCDEEEKMKGKGGAFVTKEHNTDKNQVSPCKNQVTKAEDTKINPSEQDKDAYCGRYGNVQSYVNDDEGSDSDCDSIYGTIGRHFVAQTDI